MRATLEAIREPGGSLASAMTEETTGLGIGYRWSTLAAPGPEAGAPPGPGIQERGALPGDRAPDAPCLDAATGGTTHLHRTFAGPHTTVLGFGPASAAVLREVAVAYGNADVRTCRV